MLMMENGNTTFFKMKTNKMKADLHLEEAISEVLNHLKEVLKSVSAISPSLLLRMK